MTLLDKVKLTLGLEKPAAKCKQGKDGKCDVYNTAIQSLAHADIKAKELAKQLDRAFK